MTVRPFCRHTANRGSWFTILVILLLVLAFGQHARGQINRMPSTDFDGFGRLYEYTDTSPIAGPVDEGYELVDGVGFIPNDSPSPVRVRPADKPYRIAIRTKPREPSQDAGESRKSDQSVKDDDTTTIKPGRRAWLRGTIRLNTIHVEDYVVHPYDSVRQIPARWPQSGRDEHQPGRAEPECEFVTVAAWVNRMPATGGHDHSDPGPSRHLVMTLQVKNPTRDSMTVTLDHVFLSRQVNDEGRHIAADRITLTDDSGRETGQRAATIEPKSSAELNIRGLNVFDVPAMGEQQSWLYVIVFLTVKIDDVKHPVILRQVGEIETVW